MRERDALEKFLQILKSALSVHPLAVITVIALRDHDPNRALAANSVIPNHLSCAADVGVV